MPKFEAYPEMKIAHCVTRDGGFVALVPGTNITAYAYPTSPYAVAGRRNGRHAAALMIESAIDQLPSFVEVCGYSALVENAERNHRHFVNAS